MRGIDNPESSNYRGNKPGETDRERDTRLAAWQKKKFETHLMLGRDPDTFDPDMDV